MFREHSGFSFLVRNTKDDAGNNHRKHGWDGTVGYFFTPVDVDELSKDNLIISAFAFFNPMLFILFSL